MRPKYIYIILTVAQSFTFTRSSHAVEKIQESPRLYTYKEVKVSKGNLISRLLLLKELPKALLDVSSFFHQRRMLILLPLFLLLSPSLHLNDRVFLSGNYRLIVAPRKFDVPKRNICPRSEASRANMLVLRTSNFQGATIRPIVPRHKHSIVFIVHH